MIHPSLNIMKPIRLLGYSNGNKDYQTAKRAIDKEWQKIKPLNADEIKNLISRGHWIGGVIPEGFILVDIDDKITGKTVFDGLRRSGYSFTGIETPNGYQFIFRDAGKIKNQGAKRLTLGGIVVDFRLSRKGYLVLPTENTEGRKVIHSTDRPLDPMPLLFLPVRGFKDTDTLTGRINEGSRDSFLFSHASKIREWNVAHNLNLTPEEKSQVLSELNQVFCYPPLSQNDVDRIFKSAESYPPLSNAPELKDDPTVDKKPTQVEILLTITSGLTLFHDQNKTTFTYIDNETIPLSASKLKDYLAYKFYKQEGKAPNSDSLNQVLNVLKGKALFEGRQITLHNRIAEKDSAVWYDLGNGKAVKITSNGWDITSEIPIIFRRYAHQQTQSEPSRNGNAWVIFKYLNIHEENHLLVLVYIIACFIPDIPHPIFHPHGQHGAGKTTLCNVIKRVCDPSSIEAIITPRDATQLVQVLAHHHVCLFDNMSDLPAWMSDILAQACTGGGFSKRQLFTDEEDIIFQIKRCIGLNGINLLISRSDLMDRSILLHLDRIDPAKRKDEKKLWAEFEKDKAKILGGIFDVIAMAMRIYPGINPTQLPRMADFARWGYAITKALGRDINDFSTAYRLNIEKQNEEVIQSNTLAQAVLQLLSDKTEWQGTIKQAYNALFEIAGPSKADNTFPKTERSLKRHLNRLKTNLMDKGLTYTVGDRTSEGIPIVFQQIQKTSTLSTLSTENNADNEDNFGTSWNEPTLADRDDVIEVFGVSE